MSGIDSEMVMYIVPLSVRIASGDPRLAQSSAHLRLKAREVDCLFCIGQAMSRKRPRTTTGLSFFASSGGLMASVVMQISNKPVAGKSSRCFFIVILQYPLQHDSSRGYAISSIMI